MRYTDDFYEIQSKNTKHCWIIQKHNFKEKAPIRIYHKHTLNTPYYHRHGFAYSVKSAIQFIKGHDNYVLNPQNATMASQATSH